MKIRKMTKKVEVGGTEIQEDLEKMKNLETGEVARIIMIFAAKIAENIVQEIARIRLATEEVETFLLLIDLDHVTTVRIATDLIIEREHIQELIHAKRNKELKGNSRKKESLLLLLSLNLEILT